MQQYIFLSGLVCAALLCACGTAQKNARQDELQVVPWVDLQQYAGTWYEIARYPNRFQKDCFATSVTYTLRQDGTVEVVNRCRSGSVNGEERSVRGKAWSVDPATNAKLKVQFFWPFRGNYWIIQLDENYRYAVVGNPKRNLLWILSRTPAMDRTTYDGILQRLEAQGYDPRRLIRPGHGQGS